ncbi:MAG: hypothetical protein OXC60_09825, partial [Litoreibacter sp.]|nr:hypothetical protein [Litoreibacter sp.]
MPMPTASARASAAGSIASNPRISAIKALLLGIIGAYLLYAAVMIWLHPRFIYPFQPDDVVLDGFERVELKGADGTPIYVQERKGSGPVVLYYMGNAGSLALFEGAFPPHIEAAGQSHLSFDSWDELDSLG